MKSSKKDLNSLQISMILSFEISKYILKSQIYIWNKIIKRIIVGKSFLKKLQNSNNNKKENKKQITYDSKNISNKNKSNNLENNKNLLDNHSIIEINEKKILNPLKEGIHYEYKTVKEINYIYPRKKI